MLQALILVSKSEFTSRTALELQLVSYLQQGKGEKLTERLKRLFWIQSKLGNVFVAFILIFQNFPSLLIEGVLKHVSLHV